MGMKSVMPLKNPVVHDLLASSAFLLLLGALTLDRIPRWLLGVSVCALLVVNGLWFVWVRPHYQWKAVAVLQFALGVGFAVMAFV